MRQKINELLHEAMKKGDKFKVTLYRCLKSDIETAEKNGNGNVIEVLNKALKKRLEAHEAYLAAGREDAATTEKAEAHLIMQFLPKEPTDEDIMNCILECTGNISTNMGDIIKYIKYNYPTVDGRKAATMVKDFLSVTK